MATYGPYYPTEIEGNDWVDKDNAKTADGNMAVFNYQSSNDLIGTGLCADIPSTETIVRATVGVKASATSGNGATVAIDNLQLRKNGVYIGESAFHGVGIGSDQWYEGSVDVALSPSDLNSADFGIGVCFYDSSGAELGTGEIRVDALRVSLHTE